MGYESRYLIKLYFCNLLEIAKIHSGNTFTLLWKFGIGWNGEEKHELSKFKWHARNLKKCANLTPTADANYYQQAQQRKQAKKNATKIKLSSSKVTKRKISPGKDFL